MPSEVPVRARALSIAGSDSGGGAGIQADLKTFSALGVYGMTAITAVTVQNTLGVSDYQAIHPRIVGDQIRSIAIDIGVDAAKTGMLASAPIVEAVAQAVSDTGIDLLVVDPVLVSKHGNELASSEARGAMRDLIVPLATLITPNLAEASALAGVDVVSRRDMEDAAERIMALGAGAVLVKGGHLDGATSDDLLVWEGGRRWLEAERLNVTDTHGTGCTLSAAITAHLAQGASLLTAVERGKAFVTGAIRHALSLGSGIGPVDQLWSLPR
jgi:hydroxymethylpyrimidine/phosphomethylpyrimidine kinase